MTRNYIVEVQIAHAKHTERKYVRCATYDEAMTVVDKAWKDRKCKDRDMHLTTHLPVRDRITGIDRPAFTIHTA